MKTIKINLPDGYKANQVKDGDTITIQLEKIEDELKGWRLDGKDRKYYFLNDACSICEMSYGLTANPSNRNALPSKEIAESFLALMQLVTMRDSKWYNDGWKPDWSCRTSKYTITICGNQVVFDLAYHSGTILAFKSVNLRDKFAEEFKDLIENAKSLL